MIGLNLTKLEDISTSTSPGTFLFTYPTVRVISYCSGATKLANSYLFNLLSKYDEKTGIGSNFRLLIAAPIVSQYTKDFVLVLITDELAALQSRFIAIQNQEKGLPAIEKLKKAEILNIEIDEINGVTIRAQLTTEAGTTAYVVV
jgi:hypothetical protein